MAGLKNKTPDEKFRDGYPGGGTQDRALKGTDQCLTKKPASLRKGVRRRKDSRILVDVDRWETYRFRRSSLSLELVE